MRDKVTVRSAKKQGLRVRRRYKSGLIVSPSPGLHRAADTNRYLDTLGVSLDEFEAFITTACTKRR